MNTRKPRLALSAIAMGLMAAQPALPDSGKVFLSVRDRDKPEAVQIAKSLHDLGFKLVSTKGTAKLIEKEGVPVQVIQKISTRARPNVLDLIKNNDLVMIINTPEGAMPMQDENLIRTATIRSGICLMTTLAGAKAAVDGIAALRLKPADVCPIQDYALTMASMATTSPGC